MNDKVNMRMCVHCRQMAPKKQMVRIACAEDIPFVDLDGRRGGRGAYLCSAACLESTKKKRQLDRALKCKVTEEIYQQAEEAFQNGAE